MAHGVLYLLGGWVGFHVLQSTGEWGLGLLAATAIAAAVGLVMQQLFLRWNQGQDIRQAMITIAISVIMADQILSWFGGNARSVAWPDLLDQSSPLYFFDLSYPFVRFFILFCAIAIGVAIWLWLHKTRTGMVVRAGVDDRQMVSALGVNVQLDLRRSSSPSARGLAGFSGMLGGSLISLGPGEDVNFLINSLIVVIIGGMGIARRRRDRRAPAWADRRLGRRLPRLRRRELHELLGRPDLLPAGRRAGRAAARALREAGVIGG